MANGRPNRDKGYCEYSFLDGSYCPIQLEKRITETINGKQLEKNKWEDAQKRNYCIFHSHNDEKSDEFFNELSKRIGQNNQPIIDYRNGLERSRITEEEKKKKLDEARSNNQLVLEGCYFPANINLDKATFESNVTFQKCIFKGNVTFSQTKFNGIVMFTEAEFREDVSFSGAIFNNDALFEMVKFFGDVNFTMTKFIGVSAFMNAKFGVNEELNDDVTFIGTKFGRDALFKYAKFYNKATFISGEFNSKASFEEVEFKDTTIFSTAHFMSEASFKNTIFNGIASFNMNKFEGDTFFNRTIFFNETGFSKTTFFKSVDFTDAIFIKGKLDFTRAKFPEEEAFFHNTVFNCEVFFCEQMLKGVRFSGCYLGSASFYGSDVRDAVFINSGWNRRFLEKQLEELKKRKRIDKDISVLSISEKQTRTIRSAVLFDEKIFLSSNKRNINNQKNGSESFASALDPLYLEQLYCQFKLAMDNNKMFNLANDFYHGEKLMECKRLQQEHSFLKLLFLRTYWFLSGFGNIPLFAIIWLALFLYTSSFLLITTNGLKANDLKMVFERCPCGENESQQTIFDNRNITVPVYFTKPCAVFLSKIYKVLFSTAQIHKNPVSSLKIKDTLNKNFIKNERNYSLKDRPWCNAVYVSLWNLTASPGRRSGDFRENGIWAYLAVFCIQYIFRPLMVALIIISVRRKVYRG